MKSEGGLKVLSQCVVCTITFVTGCIQILVGINVLLRTCHGSRLGKDSAQRHHQKLLMNNVVVDKCDLSTGIQILADSVIFVLPY